MSALDKVIKLVDRHYSVESQDFNGVNIDDAISELAALRSRVAELEATVSGLESDNGELSDKLAQSEALRLEAEQAAQAVLTPRPCVTCQQAAEKMREAAAQKADQLNWYTGKGIARVIRALPLPTCGDCNPLAPKPQSQASLKDQLRELVQLANANGLYDAADYIRRED